MTQNQFKAIVRSVMPFVISGVASVIARFGYHVSLDTVIQIVGIAGGGLTIVLHALEAKFPWVGVFLGWIGAPAYAPSAKKSLALTVASLQTELAALKGPAASPTVTDLTTPPA